MTISKDTMGYKQQSPDVANRINNQVSSTNIELGKNRSNLQIKKDLKDYNPIAIYRTYLDSESHKILKKKNYELTQEI